MSMSISVYVKVWWLKKGEREGSVLYVYSCDHQNQSFETNCIDDLNRIKSK